MRKFDPSFDVFVRIEKHRTIVKSPTQETLNACTILCTPYEGTATPSSINARAKKTLNRPVPEGALQTPCFRACDPEKETYYFPRFFGSLPLDTSKSKALYASYLKRFQSAENKKGLPNLFFPNFQPSPTMGFDPAYTLDPVRDQPKAVSSVLESLKTCGGAVLVLPCGFGKTICALYIASVLKLRCCILAGTIDIVNQWVERIRQYLPQSTISTSLDDAKVQTLFKKNASNATQDGAAPSTCSAYDTDFIVCLYQTVYRRDCGPLHDALSKTCGFLIVDEAHHVPSQCFFETTFKFNCKYSLGLTATPKRGDGMTTLLYWSLGPPAYVLTRKRANEILPSQISYTWITYALKDAKFYPTQAKKKVYSGKFIDSLVINDLSRNLHRNLLIANVVCNLSQNTSRKVLVLTQRRKHAHLLASLVKSPQVTVLVYLGGVNTNAESMVHYCNGKRTKQDEPPFKEPQPVGKRVSKKKKYSSQDIFDALENAQVIISTFHQFGEAKDVPRIDTLVFAAPATKTEQALGRAMRSHPEKVMPVKIIDFDDVSGHEVLVSKTRSRSSVIRSVLGTSAKHKRFEV